MLKVKERTKERTVEELIYVLRGLPPNMICKINNHNITEICIMYESGGIEHVAIKYGST